MRKIYLLLLSLILLPYMAVADTSAFNVTTNEGSSENAYTYSEGVLTVNGGANITISMAEGATEPTSDRIAVTGNAEITLNGVNITGSKYDNINETDAQSAIDVSENATLILNLSESSQNTLTGGDGESSVGAPGIHVPSSASVVIQGSGALSVTGGNSTSTYGGSGIGGKSAGGSGGETCGTVIILATGSVKITGGSGQHTSAGGADIGGGLGTTDGGNGQGIRPVSNQENTYTVWGNLELPCDITIPDGATVTIPEGASLTVPEEVTLTNNGTIKVEGALTGNVTGTVQTKLTVEMVTVAKGIYTYTGEAHEPTVTIEGYDVNTDYTVEYSNNTNAGEATITVKPTETGKLFGSAVTVNFTISQATNEWTTEPNIQGWTYNGTANTPTGAAKFGTVSFTYASKDSETYSETAPTAAGDYVLKATVAATNNYTGLEKTVEFTIAPITATLEYAETEVKKQVGDEAFTNVLTNGSSIQVSYESSNTNVATVDANGKVTILAAGTTTITATDNDPNYEAEAASYTLVVDPITLEEGSGISITGGQQEVEFDGTGTTMTLTATVTVSDGLGTDGQWIWASSNTDIATVPEHGDEAVAMLRANNATESSTATVTIHKIGEATITATYTDSKYTGEVTFNLTVTEKEEEPAPKPDPDPTPQPDPTPLYYNIQFENICEGVDASLSKSVVKEGNQVSVYVEVEEGYDAENLKVMFKRSLYGYWEEVEEGVQPGEYIIYNVYTDIYVKVEGVEKIEEEPTGMSDIEGTKVYAQNGNLYVYTSQPQEVMIITMNGTVLRRERQEGLRSYPLPKGVYIICIGEERMKVRI